MSSQNLSSQQRAAINRIKKQNQDFQKITAKQKTNNLLRRRIQKKAKTKDKKIIKFDGLSFFGAFFVSAFKDIADIFISLFNLSSGFILSFVDFIIGDMSAMFMILLFLSFKKGLLREYRLSGFILITLIKVFPFTEFLPAYTTRILFLKYRINKKGKKQSKVKKVIFKGIVKRRLKN